MATDRTLELQKPLVSTVTHGGRNVLDIKGISGHRPYRLDANGFTVRRTVPKTRGKAIAKRAKRARMQGQGR